MASSKRVRARAAGIHGQFMSRYASRILRRGFCYAAYI